MDRRKLSLLFYTVKKLRLKQVIYRLYYFFRNRFFKKSYAKELKCGVPTLHWEGGVKTANSYLGNQEFNFLNITKKFEHEIDWNFTGFGKLWTYNLNYFDFLNHDGITVDEGVCLINECIKQDALLKDGKEPYPISLRGINWIKFLSKNKIVDKEINQVLYNHYQILIHNLEYHLLGNHLLENGFSLLFGAYYFKDELFYKKAKKILGEELKEQILKDGAHFELSPMYHQILLVRVLDCINLIGLNNWKKDPLSENLNRHASNMLSWLQAITYKNGNIPMVNDCSFGIAPSSKELFDYATILDLKWCAVQLTDSGYRVFKNASYELFVDVGNVGPSYQPGHAHSDTFNFELYRDSNPIIVDTGTSTYEKSEKRQTERETSSHNTVMINNQEQTQVWGGFRVAKRAKVIQLIEDHNSVTATHDGYANLGVFHSRRFVANENEITIIDTIYENKEIQGVAYFHFHPDIQNIEINDRQVKLLNENIQIEFGHAVIGIQKETYKYALGFNKTTNACKICVSFNSKLETSIYL